MLTDVQIPKIQQFILRTEDFEGQDLNYLLEKFGQRLEFNKIKVYCGKIMINQKDDDLANQFYVEDLYKSIYGISFSPKFKEVTFSDGTCRYQMEKFIKNKGYKDYPIELTYKRVLKDRRPKMSIMSSDQEQFDSTKYLSD